jgi:hypothetical protein
VKLVGSSSFCDRYVQFIRTCISQRNVWLVNRLRKELQVVELMVHRWSEIFSTITAQAHSRGTRKENGNAENAKKNEPAAVLS